LAFYGCPISLRLTIALPEWNDRVDSAPVHRRSLAAMDGRPAQKCSKPQAPEIVQDQIGAPYSLGIEDGTDVPGIAAHG